MKKNRILGVIGILGLVGILAACTVQPLVYSDGRVTTEWITDADHYVMCGNFENTIYFTFRMADPSMLREVRQVFVGSITDEFNTGSTVRANEATISGNHVTVSHTFRSGTAPLSADADLGTSAIIVRPIGPDPEPAIAGYTEASYRVVLDNGLAYSFPLGTDGYYTIPVWEGCQR